MLVQALGSSSSESNSNSKNDESSIFGRHYMHIQGHNSDGYVGPVIASLFDIIDITTTTPTTAATTTIFPSIV